MPSYLQKYKHSTANPEEKIVRAIDSVLDQEDFELIVVADGCDRTVEIVKDRFYNQKEVKLFRVSDDRKFGAKRGAGASGYPRNAGIQQATGEYIIYLDTDDLYVDGYLRSLKDEMTDDLAWYWFDNLSWNKRTDKFDRYLANIDKQGGCGTANICHRREMGAWWTWKSYLHDWMFILTLKAISLDYRKLETSGYGVCHVPGLLDV